MKVDKDFKQEFDQEFANATYGFRKISGKILAWILALVVICSACGFGYHYLKTNADRRIFKQSITYNEGMLDDLAKYKFEYDTAADEVEQEAIATLVRNRFANFDKSKIENHELRRFLEDCGV